MNWTFETEWWGTKATNGQGAVIEKVDGYPYVLWRNRDDMSGKALSIDEAIGKITRIEADNYEAAAA